MFIKWYSVVIKCLLNASVWGVVTTTTTTTTTTIEWYSMNSIKKIWGIRCNSNPNFTRILLVIPYKKLFFLWMLVFTLE